MVWATPRADWFPRAILSGFIATLFMAMLFFVAFGAAFVLSGIQLSPRNGADTFAGWAAALTHNQVLDLAASRTYASATLHMVIGMVFALLYARFFEPILPGTGAVKGIWFSLLPWALSVLVFLPAVGGGFLGANIGAGPLPAIGNFLLHLAYGATLGTMYGPVGDIPADELSRTAPADDPGMVQHYEETTARGIVLGVIMGSLAGVVGVFLHNQPGEMILGVPPLVFVPLTGAIGAIIGALWGSFVGLAPVRTVAPEPHVYQGR